ncbi:unnamed protein product [Microthlaspi erraticum]|uniref:DUF4283 domain-containing protein n=1 Tax=Microthlaspi erraticum TaxID=1685480 RepID=A0A6D2KUH4_9BRAS|nr:unnamed protein product [Microthlaspi erraticum]
MSAAMDRALMAMSLEEEEEDKPLMLPNRPESCSRGNNALSLIGRILNPDCQKISHLLVDLPRKWGKKGRIRGVALTKERFQFFFKSEQDLLDVLEKGVQCSNEWAVAMKRWVNKEPATFLQFVAVWVQIRNLPVNHYTSQKIWDIGEVLGEVKEIAFDDTENQSQPFVRVKIWFDVSKPLRRSKLIHLPDGEEVTVYFYYENLQKRCFNCHRLNHEKDFCPLLVKARQEQAAIRRTNVVVEKRKSEPVLKESDPLFGVLSEDQVGVNPITGKLKINPEVKKDRVKSTVAQVEKDPHAQKVVLRLESAPVITRDAGAISTGERMSGRFGPEDLRSHHLDSLKELKGEILRERSLVSEEEDINSRSQLD